MKFLNLFKKEHKGAIAPEFRRYSAPPMPKVAPCKKEEDDFPNYDTLREISKSVQYDQRKESYNNILHNISRYMLDCAEDGYFEISMILRQYDYPGLDLSKPESDDCQDIRDYIIAKDPRYTVIFKPFDDYFRKHVYQGAGVTLVIKWGDEDEGIVVNVDPE